MAIRRKSLLFDNIKNGNYKNWYENGNLKSDRFLTNGIYSIQKEWYENGQLKTVSLYRNGVFDGEYKNWYEDGSPRKLVFTIMVNLKELLKKWYNNGQLL